MSSHLATRPLYYWRFRQEVWMSVNNYANNLDTAVRYALETTRAIAVCPFHSDVTNVSQRRADRYV